VKFQIIVFHINQALLQHARSQILVARQLHITLSCMLEWNCSTVTYTQTHTGIHVCSGKKVNRTDLLTQRSKVRLAENIQLH